MDIQALDEDEVSSRSRPQQLLCRNCKKSMRGRTDKKFCNEICRNRYYNQLHAAPNNLVRNINHSLGKNRRILEAFLDHDRRNLAVSPHQLLEKGFMFKYFTHVYTNKRGNTYFYCYDYGYLPLENKYILVRGIERDCRDSPLP